VAPHGRPVERGVVALGGGGMEVGGGEGVWRAGWGREDS
jgi:hypothetical protein